jgi:DNA-binding NtrC family response regulator
MPRENLPSPVVLVVDDEALIRWSLSEGLAESGYAVRAASTGAEALSVLADCLTDPVVVLLDLRLPVVGDLSLLRAMRRTRPDAPVLVMTAHGAPEDTEEAQRLGAAHVVGKPFDVGEMVRLVGEAWSAVGA